MHLLGIYLTEKNFTQKTYKNAHIEEKKCTRLFKDKEVYVQGCSRQYCL